MSLTGLRTSCVVSFVHKPGCAFVYQLLGTLLHCSCVQLSFLDVGSGFLRPFWLLAPVRPTVPVTTLLIEPKQLFRPMFQFPGYACFADVEPVQHSPHWLAAGLILDRSTPSSLHGIMLRSRLPGVSTWSEEEGDVRCGA